jgi:hypothetical protein
LSHSPEHPVSGCKKQTVLKIRGKGEKKCYSKTFVLMSQLGGGIEKSCISFG